MEVIAITWKIDSLNSFYSKGEKTEQLILNKSVQMMGGTRETGDIHVWL